MFALLKNLASDEAGLILSAELIIILTVAVLGMVVGLANVQTALLGEFADIGLAFQSLNQSYSTPSYRGCWKYWGRTSWVAGSSFIDIFDGCVGSGPAGYSNIGNTGGDIVSGSSCYLPTVAAPVATGVPATVAPVVQPDAIPATTVPCTTCK